MYYIRHALLCYTTVYTRSYTPLLYMHFYAIRLSIQDDIHLYLMDGTLLVLLQFTLSDKLSETTVKFDIHVKMSKGL